MIFNYYEVINELISTQKENINEDSIMKDMGINIQDKIKNLIQTYKSPLEDIEIVKEPSEIFYSYPGISKGVYGFYDPDNECVHMIKESEFPNDGKFGTYNMLIIHECMHAILDSIGASCSMDFQEGICTYESEQIRLFDGKSFKSKNIYIKYGRLVESIIKQYGYDKLLSIIGGMEPEPLPTEQGIDESSVFNDNYY